MITKRPIRLNPAPFKSEPIVSGEEIYAAQKTAIDQQTMAKVGQILKPSLDYAAMIRVVCDRKTWSLPTYANYSCIHISKLTKIVNAGAQPNQIEARMIFFVYHLDTNPEKLKNQAFVLTWGHTESNQVRYTRNASQIVAEFLKTAPPKMDKQSILDALVKQGNQVSLRTIINVAEETGYKLGKRKPIRKTRLLDPGSVWLNVNWAYSNEEIARKLGKKPATVRNVRYRMKRFKFEELTKAFSTAGRDEYVVWVLLRS